MTNTDDLTGRKTRLSEARRALLLKRMRGQKTESQTDGGIMPQSQSGPLPLSYTQQRVWFLQQLFPDNKAYNMLEAWRVKGPLDVDALQKALNAVAARQAVLRTSFFIQDNEPGQQVIESFELKTPVIDLSHLPPKIRQAKLREVVLAEENAAFDLTNGPLIRLSVIHLDREDYALLLSLHHIITDEWSNDIFWRELQTFYAQVQRSGIIRLPDLPIHYSDYAQWQRHQAASGVFDQQMRYWQKQLSGELPLIQLPFDRPRSSEQSLRGGMLRRTLSADLLDALKALSQQAGATMYMTLLAAFQLLLHRYSGQDDILVGTPIANRQRSETQDVMGMFINTAVMRADLSGNPSFLQLLAQVRQTALDALVNQDLPFDLLVQAMHPERDLSYNPLFQTMFVYRSDDVARTLPGLNFEAIEVEHRASKFDLTLFAGEKNGRFFSALEYSDDLFERETAERMLDHWQTLLQAIVANPNAPVESLPLLSAAERKLVIETFNDTAVPLAETRCLHELFAAQALLTPKATAVISENNRLTYGELDARANQLAYTLLRHNMQPGAPIGLYVERSAELLIGILGILKAGGAYVPLEPGYPAERTAYALKDTGALLIVTQSHLADRLPPTEAAIVTLPDEPEDLSVWAGKPPETAVSLDNLAYIIYTSGSTGKPKGVMVTHRNLLASTLARKAYYGAPVQRYLLLSSFAFDSSVAGLFWTLADGGALLLPAPDDEKDVQKLAAIIAQEQVTHTLALPTLYRLLLDYAPPQSLDSLKAVIVAGEACPPDLGEKHYNLLPDTALYNEYGPTEATVWCSVYQLPRVSDGGPVPIGRPIANSQLLILDSSQQPVPVGAPGELYVSGAGITPGYWNNPALTAERFPTLVLEGYPDIGRVYRTGDLARWRADGQIEFLGRVDNQVKIRGFRIEPGEIEAILLRHPSVQESAVTVWDQSRNGSGSDKSLIAYVVTKPFAGAQVNGSLLKEYLAGLLPDYMAPRHVIALPSLPRTPNGKVDRKKLPKPALETERKRPFMPPRSETEKTLARIWSEILRMPEISIEDKFFELGGDSIMSIQVIARARQEGLVLTPRQLFQEQTIARLAAVAAPAGNLIVAQAPAAGPVPLTPIQHWFFEQRLRNPAHWNQAAWFEVTTTLNIDHLNAALAHLSVHHAMLRARYRPLDTGWRQEVLPEASPISVAIKSLTAFEPAAQDRAMLTAANELHAGLDLANGPLLEGILFDLGANRPPRLLLILHHLVVDTVSWSILASDLATAYQQTAAAETVSLPAPVTSYAQWAQSLSNYARSKTMRQEAVYWLENITAETALPRDDSTHNSNTEGQADLLAVSLDQENTGLLLRDVHEAYHTRIEDLLLTALVRAIASWTGEPSLLLTLERHGREEIDARLDVSQTVGWFTSLAPICLKLDNIEDIGANLREVKEQLRRVPQNGVGYGILRYLGDEDIRKQLKAQPRPEILFNYFGQARRHPRADAPLRPLQADIGQAYGPQNERAHLIDINARISDGRLIVNWQYAASYFQRTTIDAVANAYIAELEQLIGHCIQVDQSRHTPSDFPLAQLEQDDLDSLSDLLAGLD